MKNKTVKFNIKIINDGKVYLKASDVAKTLGYSNQQDFINDYPSLVEKISGIPEEKRKALQELMQGGRSNSNYLNMVEYQLINLSKPDVDHDFRECNIMENMIWCIQNLDVTALEDCEYSVFGYFDRIINFDMDVELLVKILKPAAVSTIYTDKLIDVETGTIITDFDSEKVFKEDFSN